MADRRAMRKVLTGIAGAATVATALVAGPAPAQAAGSTTVAAVTGCGALAVKTELWGAWQEHMRCNTVREVAVSPDGQRFAVRLMDNSLHAKTGLWGDWKQHLGAGDAKSVALGPNGMVAAVTGCGALAVKTELWGAWQEHMRCNTVREVAVSPDGQRFAVRLMDNSLHAKTGLWGGWKQHLGAGDAKSVALGPNGLVAAVTGCGAVAVKTEFWGAWQEHMRCNRVREVAVSPDGQQFAVRLMDNSLHAKTGLWGTWQRHLGGGDARSVSLAGTDPDEPVPGTLPEAIRTIARQELANPQRNEERGGANCNFYTAAAGVGRSTCSNGWRSQQWCADFARWVWGKAGANTDGLDAGAVSFYRYGKAKNTWKSGGAVSNAKVGDAAVYNMKDDGSWAQHVGLVTAVNREAGTITVLGGNTPKEGTRYPVKYITEKTLSPVGVVSGYASPVK